MIVALTRKMKGFGADGTPTSLGDSESKSIHYYEWGADCKIDTSPMIWNERNWTELW